MKGKSHLLRFTALLFIMAAANTLDDFQPVQGEEPNSRSRREATSTSSSVIEYMERLRDSLSDEQGKPRLASPEDPTEVWGMQDIDVLSESYRPKPRMSERCTATNKFFFNWNSLSQSLQHKQLPVDKATLRVHMKVIPRLFRRRSSIPVSMDVYMTSSGLNSTSARVHAGHTEMTVTLQSTLWVELDIGTGVRSLWPPRENETHVEITVVIRTNCDVSKKVPVIFEDPTSIPVQQTKRRQKLYSKQPIFLVFLSDEEVKETIKSESVTLEDSPNDNVETAGAAAGAGERQRRSVSDGACDIEDYWVVFADLQLTQIYAPLSYNARQCSGSCSHHTISLDTGLANNHAKIMASAKALSARPDSLIEEPEAPCCVPTKYSPLTLVIPQADRSLKYVVYSHMIVEECKCR